MSEKAAATKKPEKVFQTTSHIVINPFYTPADLAGFNYEKELNAPGSFPFTRGVQASMYRGRLWTMRQYAGMGDAEESNKRYRFLLSQGTTGLSVAFDLPTQIGYDSDSPFALGEVGKVGVAIDTIEDMQRLFDSIDLEKVSTSMTINSSAAVLLSLYVAVAKRNGFDPKKLSGTIQNDVLKEYIARGTYIYPPTAAMRLITDIFAYLQRKRAGVEHDFDQRLSHARGGLDGGAGSGVYAGRRHYLRAGGSGCGTGREPVCAAAVVLLCLPQ